MTTRGPRVTRVSSCRRRAASRRSVGPRDPDVHSQREGSGRPVMTPGSGTVVDARTSLALWLRDGRARKKLSLDDVARITKIQPRILEKLERGELDGLPAEVFVKGFVRSFARCVGLDEGEALDRYTQCRAQTTQSHVARALVETMSQLAPVAARTAAPIEVVEVIDVAAPITGDELI